MLTLLARPPPHSIQRIANGYSAQFHSDRSSNSQRVPREEDLHREATNGNNIEEVQQQERKEIAKTVPEEAIQTTIRNTRFNIKTDAPAWKIMEHMGYKRWQGLGKKNQGTVDPIEAYPTGNGRGETGNGKSL